MKSQTMKSIVASFLFVMLLGGALQARQVKVDHSSKEALVESFLLAAAYGDADGLWQILAPACRKMMLSGTFGDEEQVKKLLWESGIAHAGKQGMAQIKAVVHDDNKLKASVKEGVKIFEPGLVQINGKWYLDAFKMLASTATAQDDAALKKPERIDHSTPESLVEGFTLAVIFKDADLLWEAVSPASRLLLLQDSQRVAQGKQWLLNSLSKATPQLLQKMRSALPGKGKQGTLASVVRRMRSRGLLTQIDGKWFLQIPDSAK